MKTTLVATLVFAAASQLGCTREESRGPVRWTASNPSSPIGQTEAQAWNRSTENDEPEPAPPAGATRAAPLGSPWQVQPPPEASFTSSASNGQDVERDCRTDRSYADAVGYFDRAFAAGAFHDVHRTSTPAATYWSARTAGGDRASVAVRAGSPTRIEIVEAEPALVP